MLSHILYSRATMFYFIPLLIVHYLCSDIQVTFNMENSIVRFILRMYFTCRQHVLAGKYLIYPYRRILFNSIHFVYRKKIAKDISV